VAGKILKEDVDALRQQADILAVVGDYTTLKRAGRSYKGLCPFHTERTPSFNVTPDGNFYTCFGCGVSGDIYDFLMRIEGLSFPEAVENLARRTGFTLRYEQMSARERRAVGERSRLVEVTAAARDAFRERLHAPEGEVAREYLKSRGFGREEADAFELGFAPNRWDDISRQLTAQGLPAADLVTTGIAARNDRGGLRDRFRGRLIFPIHDPGGDVIGFGGRVLPTIDYGGFDPPKYLNSAETPLYKKTQVLYGIRQARPEIVRAESVLVCEGYTDVMALHQAGFGNAVATCGTAVGVEHLRIVARYVRRVVLAFDGDEAGLRAAERAWDALRTLQQEGSGVDVELRVLALDGGSDPADLVAALGADGLREAVDAAVPIVPFVIRHHLARADLATEQGRATALRDAVEVLGREPDPDLRRAWAKREVADGIGVAYDFVVRTAGRSGVDLDAHEGIAATSGAGGGRRGGERTPVTAQHARRERAVLRAAVQTPEYLPEEWFELAEEDFSHPRARAVLRALHAAGGAGVPLEVMLEHAEDDQVRTTLRELALEDDPEVADPAVAAEVVGDRVRHLVAERVRGRARDLVERLSRLNHSTDRDEILELQRRLGELERRRRELTVATE
jgi:DNA primase